MTIWHDHEPLDTEEPEPNDYEDLAAFLQLVTPLLVRHAIDLPQARSLDAVGEGRHVGWLYDSVQWPDDNRPDSFHEFVVNAVVTDSGEQGLASVKHDDPETFVLWKRGALDAEGIKNVYGTGALPSLETARRTFSSLLDTIGVEVPDHIKSDT